MTLTAAARERLENAIAAGRLAPHPSPETIRRIADVVATKPSGETK
jgi:hypothetical protein